MKADLLVALALLLLGHGLLVSALGLGWSELLMLDAWLLPAFFAARQLRQGGDHENQ